MNLCVKRGSKIITLSLCSLILTIFIVSSFPVNGIAVEAVVISGIIAASTVALGVELINMAGGFDNLAQTLYDKWSAFRDSAGKTDNDILDGVQIVNNKLQLANSTASIIYDYVEQTTDFTQTYTPKYKINGKYYDYSFNGRASYVFPFDTALACLCNDGYVHTFVLKGQPNSLEGELYIDGSPATVSSWGNANLWTNQYYSAGSYGVIFWNPYDYETRIGWVNEGMGTSGRYVVIGNDYSLKILSSSLQQDVQSKEIPELNEDDIYIDIGAEDIETVEEFAELAINELEADKLESAIVDEPIDDPDIPIEETQTVKIEGEVRIAEAELPDIDGITWGDIPEMLTTVFPFSIPWDVKRGLEAVQADPVAPIWTITFPEVGGLDTETEITIDLTTELWTRVFGFLRWAQIILWCAGLASASSKLIWGSD